jgi:acetylglutamate kinase
MNEKRKAGPQEQAEILMQALPHMLRYDEAIIVVKYGGHAMGDEATGRDFARDMVLLEQSGVNPVVVHGGGPQIGSMLEKLGIQSRFSGGLRITDKATVEIVEMVLAGAINKQIVGTINAQGGRAIGLCGKDGNMVTARKMAPRSGNNGSDIEDVIDLGFVGEAASLFPSWRRSRKALTARPTTSTPTHSPAPSRAPSAPSACCY